MKHLSFGGPTPDGPGESYARPLEMSVPPCWNDEATWPARGSSFLDKGALSDISSSNCSTSSTISVALERAIRLGCPTKMESCASLTVVSRGGWGLRYAPCWVGASLLRSHARVGITHTPQLLMLLGFSSDGQPNLLDGCEDDVRGYRCA
jgi:hypothetical protein